MAEINPDDLIKYAGTPDGIPKALKEKYWGYLNKQLAFAKWNQTDRMVMEETLRQQELKEMANLTEEELLANTNAGWDQIKLVAMGAMSLGEGGFLIKQSRTNEQKYNFGEGEQSRKFMDRFSKKKEDA